MNKNQILEEVQEIFRDVLDNEEIVLNENTVADDVEGWDSLAHVQLVSEIQKKFGIKFSAKEMISWDTVGDMCKTIQSKLS